MATEYSALPSHFKIAHIYIIYIYIYIYRSRQLLIALHVNITLPNDFNYFKGPYSLQRQNNQGVRLLPPAPAGHCSYYFLVGSEPRFACVISCSSCLFRCLVTVVQKKAENCIRYRSSHEKDPRPAFIKKTRVRFAGVHPRSEDSVHIIQTNRVCTKSASVKAPLKFYY